MSKRPFRPTATSQTGPGRNRRMTPRRTPEDNVRVAAAWVLERTLASLAPVDSFLEGALTSFDERDQGLLRELVMGSLRWLRRLDHVIAAASNRSFDAIEPARPPKIEPPPMITAAMASSSRNCPAVGLKLRKKAT